jgi:sugar lactone lactonase YvrE
MRSIFGRLGIAVLLLVLIAAVGIRVRFGGGAPYIDLSTEPLLGPGVLEKVLDYPEPVGNIAMTGTGRLFFTVHPESAPEGHKLLEVTGGRAKPYPSADDQNRLFDTVLGLTVDSQNRLWTIDHGQHGANLVRLLAFDLATDGLVFDMVLGGDVAPLGSFVQDLQVDIRGDKIYLADASIWRKQPGLIVVDIGTRTARRVLDGHPSVKAQDWIIQTPVKRMTFLGGLLPLKAGVDGIALSKDSAWLYFAAMSHEGLYRIPVATLRDARLDPASLAARVERISRKPLSDGLTADAAGHVYVTDVEHGAVMRVTPAGQLETVIRSPLIRWADSLSLGPEGWIYVADSAMPDQILQSRRHIEARGTYQIWRFKLPADGPKAN